MKVAAQRYEPARLHDLDAVAAPIKRSAGARDRNNLVPLECASDPIRRGSVLYAPVFGLRVGVRAEEWIAWAALEQRE